jgi:NhaP-type Na+/H+ or K+/H+ antiporter
MGVLLTLLPAVSINIPPNLILGLLLPPLIFEGAFNLNIDNLRRDLIPILFSPYPGDLAMIVVGLLVTWGISYLSPWPWSSAQWWLRSTR